MTMSSRERILTVLRGGKADRPPWIPLCSWTYFESTPHHQAGADWMSTEGLRTRIDFFSKIGADYMQWVAFPYYVDTYCMLVLRTRTSSKVTHRETVKGNTKINEYETPVGTLTGVETFSEDGHTTFHEKDLLETVDDMKVYQYIVETIGYESDHESLAEQIEVLGEDGVLFVSAPPPPLKSFLLGAMRLQNAVFMIQDHKNEFDQLVQVVDEKNVEIYRMLAESPATVLHDAAVVGLGMISPDLYREYYLPCTRKYADILHQAGKLYTNHSSGERIGHILDEIVESGIDGLYGLVQPPVADCRISEVRDRFGGKIAVMGGIPSDFIATQGPEAVKKKAREILQDTAPGGHFMLGTVDDTPYGAPPENLKAVSEVIQEYGSI